MKRTDSTPQHPIQEQIFQHHSTCILHVFTSLISGASVPVQDTITPPCPDVCYSDSRLTGFSPWYPFVYETYSGLNGIRIKNKPLDIAHGSLYDQFPSSPNTTFASTFFVFLEVTLAFSSQRNVFCSLTKKPRNDMRNIQCGQGILIPSFIITFWWKSSGLVWTIIYSSVFKMLKI